MAIFYEHHIGGDYDVEGDLDGGDFLVWQRHFGSPPGTLPNDPTGSSIGAPQFNFWESNFIASSAPLAAVPELPAWALVFAGVVTALRARSAFGIERSPRHPR